MVPVGERWVEGSQMRTYTSHVEKRGATTVLNVDWTVILFANIVTGAAALIGSLTGFGYALLATPLLVLVLPARTAVPLVLASSVVLLCMLVYEARADMDVRRIGRWALGAAPGMLIGGYVLSVVSDGHMRSVIGGITLAAAVVLWLRPSHPWRREWPGALAAGALSGVLAGASGMSGPPVILFGLKQQWPHRVLRATLIGYFALVHMLALFVLGGMGMVDATLLESGSLVLPGVIAGLVFGLKWRNRVDQALFRYIALGLLGATGILALVGV